MRLPHPGDEAMSDLTTKCTACKGRGYHNCECWPGDCICGFGDETCEECSGNGFIDPSYDDFDPTTPETISPPLPTLTPETKP